MVLSLLASYAMYKLFHKIPNCISASKNSSIVTFFQLCHKPPGFLVIIYYESAVYLYNLCPFMLETVQTQAYHAVYMTSVLNCEILYIAENTIQCSTLPDTKGLYEKI